MNEQILYIHKLNAQELGFRHGSSHKAGRYIYVSKKYLNFFPQLSESIKNDHILIDIIPPDSDKLILTNYVYHNDKIVDSKSNGRNEFRIYLNEGNDLEGNYYQPNDIVVIQSVKIDDSATYKIYKFDQIQHGVVYRQLDELLRRYDSAGASHAMIPFDELKFLSIPQYPTVDLQSKVLPNDVKETIFSAPVGVSLPSEGEVIRKIRSANFRDLVLMFYDYKCAVTGRSKIIEYGTLTNLEAAHIYAFSKSGGDNPSNGIPLIKDIHWAFDNGFFTLTPEFKIKVHDNAMKISYLAEYNNRIINLPEDSRARPNMSSIEWHNKNVFGQFVRKQ